MTRVHRPECTKVSTKITGHLNVFKLAKCPHVILDFAKVSRSTQMEDFLIHRDNQVLRLNYITIHCWLKFPIIFIEKSASYNLFYVTFRSKVFV